MSNTKKINQPTPADEEVYVTRHVLWDWKGVESLSMPELDELVKRIATALTEVRDEGKGKGMAENKIALSISRGATGVALLVLQVHLMLHPATWFALCSGAVAVHAAIVAIIKAIEEHENR